MKTSISKAVVRITALSLFLSINVFISGCSDPTIGDFSFGSGGGGGGGGGYEWPAVIGGGPQAYQPTIWLDSSTEVTDSSMTVCGHIQYDSVMVLDSLTITSYTGDPYADPGRILSALSQQSDTIDFRTLQDSTFESLTRPAGRKEWIYRYKVHIDSLESNRVYAFSARGMYLQQGIAKDLWSAFPARDIFGNPEPGITKSFSTKP